MLIHLPAYISVIFLLTCFVCLLFLHINFRNVKISRTNGILAGMLLWLMLEAVLSLNGFYHSNTKAIPPAFVLAVLPPLLLILLIFSTKKGRSFTDKLSLENLTYLHTIRIPVELVLYWLYVQKAVPEIMTFEGRNFDILSGITAPVIGFLTFSVKRTGKRALLIWNFIALALLLNIVIHAALSAPFAFQQLAFEQPNIAVLYFPFVFLPAFVVPAVLFAHLTAIRRLLK